MTKQLEGLPPGVCHVAEPLGRVMARSFLNALNDPATLRRLAAEMNAPRASHHESGCARPKFRLESARPQKKAVAGVASGDRPNFAATRESDPRGADNDTLRERAIARE